MGKRLTIFLIFLLTAFLMLKINVNENKALEFSPSKGWGMFFNTKGDIKINITEPGVAVKIEVPREFLEGKP